MMPMSAALSDEYLGKIHRGDCIAIVRTRRGGDQMPNRLWMTTFLFALGACSGVIGAGTGSGSGGASGSTQTGGAGVGIGGVPTEPPKQGTDPGRVTIHRLNRVEYNNTVADLLGTSLRPADNFPVDDRGGGFDNMADVLTLSSTQLSLYRQAASDLVDDALANATLRSKLVTCDLAQQGATCARTTL